MTDDKRKTRSSKRKLNAFLTGTNIIYWIAIFSIICTGLYIGYKLYNYFEDTAEWDKVSLTKIADEEPYALYLTPEDRQNMMYYNKLVSEMYDKTNGDLNKGATYEKWKEIQDEYNKLPEAIKEKEEYIYNIIVSLYPIKREYNTFFDEDGSINSEVTPNQIKKFIDKNGSIIKKQLDDETDTSRKVFVNEVYGKIHALKDDVDTIGKMIVLFDNTYDVQTSKILVKKDVGSSHLIDWSKYKEELNFKWEIIENYMDKIIINSSSILVEHDSQINKIEVYNKIKEDKENFNDFLKKYNEHKDKLMDIPELSDRKDLEKEEYKDKIIFEIVEEYSETIAENKVISQYPTKEDFKKIYTGSKIRVVISKGSRFSSSSNSSSSITTPSSTVSSSSSSSSNSSSTNTETGEDNDE